MLNINCCVPLSILTVIVHFPSDYCDRELIFHKHCFWISILQQWSCDAMLLNSRHICLEMSKIYHLSTLSKLCKVAQTRSSLFYKLTQQKHSHYPFKVPIPSRLGTTARHMHNNCALALWQSSSPEITSDILIFRSTFWQQKSHKIDHQQRFGRMILQ